MILNRLKTTILLSLMAALFISIGYLIGSTTGLIIGFIFAMGINFFSYWYSDKIVLKLYKAKEVSKSHKLYQIVAEISRRAKIPTPKVYTIAAPTPNAFATGRNYKNSAVAATESLIDMLSEEELKGVIAHEISHIKHRDTLIQTIAVGIASAISMIANMLQWAMIFGFGGGDEENGMSSLAGMLVIIILTPIIATLIQLAISRQREYLSDAGAAKLMRNPHGLIGALEKLEMAARRPHRESTAHSATASLFIVNPFRGNSLFKLFSTHPSTEDRIDKLKKMRF